MKTIEEQLTSAKRELALRKNAYKSWVLKGSMKPEVAQHEIFCMDAIVHTLALVKAVGMEPLARMAEERGQMKLPEV